MIESQIELAGRIIKVMKLANTPGMDKIAIKLNSGLTWKEQQEAKHWAKAFELAKQGGDIFVLASELFRSDLKNIRL